MCNTWVFRRCLQNGDTQVLHLRLIHRNAGIVVYIIIALNTIKIVSLTSLPIKFHWEGDTETWYLHSKNSVCARDVFLENCIQNESMQI